MGTSIEGGFTLTPPVFSKRLILGDTEQPIQSIYETSSTQKYHVGTKLIYPDGRVFRYAKNGGVALVKARMTSSEPLYARAVIETQTVSGGSQAIGDQELDVDIGTGGTWVENEYADGYLSVDSSTGIGDIYKIVAHKELTTVLMRVMLETPLRTAWSATTVVSMVKSAWQDVVVMPVTAEGTPSGVPLVAVTAEYYCWLQTGGYAPLLVDDGDTIVKGTVVGLGGTDAGAVQAVGADTSIAYGVVVFVAQADQTAIIDLKLDS